MNPEEQELMTRAHRLALAQKEVNLLPKLLGLQGDEKQRAEAQLAAIRSERDHLDALLRQDPHAVALEQNRLNEADRANEQVISQTNIDIALGPIHPEDVPLDEVKKAVAQDLDALNNIKNPTTYFLALATMVSSAQVQSYRTELEQRAPEIASEVALVRAAVTHAWETMEIERGAAIQRAEHAVADYIGTEQSAEYAYSDTFNPNGLPDSHFHEQARLARIDMMKALAALPDDVAEAVLERKQAVDHDRSTYPVAQIGEVRAYRAALTGCAEASVTEAEHQRANEELRFQSVSTVARDLRDAIEWGDEQGFHDAFEAIRNNPALDAAATVEIAKVVTGQADVPPTQVAALGAIEQRFYDEQRSLQQTHAQGMGR